MELIPFENGRERFLSLPDQPGNPPHLVQIERRNPDLHPGVCLDEAVPGDLLSTELELRSGTLSITIAECFCPASLSGSQEQFLGGIDLNDPAGTRVVQRDFR